MRPIQQRGQGRGGGGPPGSGRGGGRQDHDQPGVGPQAQGRGAIVPQGQGRGAGDSRGQGRGAGDSRGQGHGDGAPAQGVAVGAWARGPPPGMNISRIDTPHVPIQFQGQRQQQPASAGQAGDMSTVISKMALTKITTGGKEIAIQDKISAAGTKGRRIRIKTNHIELRLGNVKKAIHYDINFEPVTPKKLVKEAYMLFKKAYFENFNPAFDGRKNVYSAKELPFGDSVTGTVVVEEAGMRSKEFKVKMTKVSIVNLEAIQQFLNQAKNQRVIEEPRDAMQVLDIVLRYSTSVHCINVGRSFFTPPSPKGEIIDLGNGMEMYKGFFQSVTMGWKPFLNVDVANKAFPKSQKVIDLIKELCPRADLRNQLDKSNFENLNKFIKGLRVEYIVPGKPSSKRRYRVNGVYGSAKEITFDYKNGQGQVRNMSVLEYFRVVYNVRLQYPSMPCLWVGNMQKEEKTYLPCEFCQILPSQPVQRKLDANQTRKMIKQCATSTDDRKHSIKTSIEQANYNKDPVVNEFDLNISTEFLNLDARVLNPPDIRYKDGNASVQKGVWAAKIFLESVKITRWTILNLDAKVKSDDLDKLTTSLRNVSGQLGMLMGAPLKPFQSIRSNVRNVLLELTTFLNSNKSLQITFVVIPEEDKMYNLVKRAAEVAVGCLTQCMRANTVFNKMNPATIKNILLKVNAKLNGANHILAKRPPIMDVLTMIMGADVTHPSPDSKDIPSVAAVTASHDPKAFKYNICWRLQPPTVEIIEDLENITKEQILYYCKMNQTWPQRIIFYRDGVSNGQFQQVLQVELQAIRRACTKINEACKPSITFIVVQKRHHTRFFPSNPRDSEDKHNNVPAGTCVDTEIVHPTRQNFFLVSHASIQGVARPTKYVTLWDDNDFSNDALESLTYHLCHMFARCTRSVSYPAPTYYAHLAAARAKVYIETSHLNLDDLKSEQRKLEIKENIVKGFPMFFV